LTFLNTHTKEPNNNATVRIIYYKKKNPVTTGKIVAITTKSLGAVVINFEAIGLRNTKISLQ